MPRVSEEYLAGKRKEITDAAHRVCLRKPVSMVTMTDIINDPERTAKIMSGLKSEGNLEHLINRTVELMGKAAATGELHPRQPLEDII